MIYHYKRTKWLKFRRLTKPSIVKCTLIFPLFHSHYHSTPDSHELLPLLLKYLPDMSPHFPTAALQLFTQQTVYYGVNVCVPSLQVHMLKF